MYTDEFTSFLSKKSKSEQEKRSRIAQLDIFSNFDIFFTLFRCRYFREPRRVAGRSNFRQVGPLKRSLHLHSRIIECIIQWGLEVSVTR